MSLNLARRPFVNSRPITRLAVVLWLAGGALALWNGAEIWRLSNTLGERRHALAEMETRAVAGQQRIAALQAELRGIDLFAENERSSFLNREIDRRTLSWTTLFQRLGEVLPRQVRLVQIVPTLASPAQRRGPVRGAAASGWISLGLTGYAESDEALLDFVDALFAHPAFASPDLQRESVPAGQPIQFELRVDYQPLAAPAGEKVASRPAASDRGAGERTAAATPMAAGSEPGPGLLGGSIPPPAGVARAVPLAPAPGAAASSVSIGEAAVPEAAPVAEGSAVGAPGGPSARWAPRTSTAVDSGAVGGWGEAPSASVPVAGGRASAPRAGQVPLPLGTAASATRRLR